MSEASLMFQKGCLLIHQLGSHELVLNKDLLAASGLLERAWCRHSLLCGKSDKTCWSLCKATDLKKNAEGFVFNLITVISVKPLIQQFKKHQELKQQKCGVLFDCFNYFMIAQRNTKYRLEFHVSYATHNCTCWRHWPWLPPVLSFLKEQCKYIGSMLDCHMPIQITSSSKSQTLSVQQNYLSTFSLCLPEPFFSTDLLGTLFSHTFS